MPCTIISNFSITNPKDLLKLKRIYLLLAFIFLVQFLFAQIDPPPISNLRKLSISTTEQTIKIDSMSLVPGSVSIDGVSPFYYKVDEVNSTITWLEKPNVGTVTVTYRVFPYKLNAVVRHLNYDSIRNNFLSNNSFTLRVGAKQIFASCLILEFLIVSDFHRFLICAIL